MCSLEPDPGNAAILERTIAANRATGVWTLARSAVANRSGHVSFMIGRLAESRLAIDNERGVPVELVDVFSLDHDVDLCKMDIEASEWTILADERFAHFGARVIVLEWHSLLSPQPDPRGAVHRLLASAGYRVSPSERVSPDGFTGLVWGYRDREA
jgi:FkbM family methyltransferase